MIRDSLLWAAFLVHQLLADSQTIAATMTKIRFVGSVKGTCALQFVYLVLNIVSRPTKVATFSISK